MSQDDAKPTVANEDVPTLLAAFMGLGFVTGTMFMLPDERPERQAAKATLEANATTWADAALEAAARFDDADLAKALREAADTLHAHAAR